ncbi:MAG: dockerin type I repeat-containing protein, partial [Ruminococcus sp.]|nr:dockerin type I repeat-containing protein [Ruminococcus sp.]
MKNALCLMLVITILSAVASVSVYAAGSRKYGDVDLNNKVNINDATIIQRYLIKSYKFDETQKTLADFDGNGYIDISDVTAIQKMLAKTDYRYSHEFCALSEEKAPE